MYFTEKCCSRPLILNHVVSHNTQHHILLYVDTCSNSEYPAHMLCCLGWFDPFLQENRVRGFLFLIVLLFIFHYFSG